MYQVQTDHPLAIVPDDDAFDPRDTADNPRCQEFQAAQARAALRARGGRIRAAWRRDLVLVAKILGIALAFVMVMHARGAEPPDLLENLQPKDELLNAIIHYRYETPRDVDSDYIPPYIECSIIGFDNSEGGYYGWTLARGGSAERLSVDAVYVRPGPVYCSLLGVEPVMFGQARWFYIVKLEDGPGSGGQTLRAAPTSQVCNADIDGDGAVNFKDLGVMRASFFMPNCDRARCAADLNGDGVVNVLDVGRIRRVFGRKCR